jgi:hypothetical protein
LDELDAAADIVQWETEQANASAMGRNHFSISDELAAAAEIADWDFGHQNGENTIISTYVSVQLANITFCRTHQSVQRL